MTPKRVRMVAIISGLVLSGLTLIAWTQVWFDIRLETGQSLPISGDVAAPALTALALSGFALAGALAIAGVVLRIILGILQGGIGALITTSAALALADPITASARSITAATGVSGSESISGLVSQSAASAWPVLSLLFGILLVGLGAAIVVTARLWPSSSRKYQAVRLEHADGERTPAADWDALSDGRDPTESSR